MGNISTNLLRFNGEIGPQYLDPDDKTGGPDGTMKPITKDVLREMIMLNLPEIQKVQDEYVKAELESIKQTQQQILQRLNQPINTQLTGSKVEKILVFNALTLDTTKELDSQIFDVSKFQQIHVLAQNTLNAALTIRMRIDGIWVRSKDDAQGSWILATIEPHVNYTYSLNTYKPYLFQNVINTVQFVIKAENPPTSGSVTIKILGRY